MAQSVERQTVNLQVPGSRVHEVPGEGESFTLVACSVNFRNFWCFFVAVQQKCFWYLYRTAHKIVIQLKDQKKQ